MPKNKPSTSAMVRLLIIFIAVVSFSPQSHGQFKVSENSRFILRDGKPFFWLGDTAWELFHRLSTKDATYYFCKASIPRALDENELATLAKKNGLNGSTFKTVPEALKKAIKQAKVNDLVFVGGSTFTVADALSL